MTGFHRVALYARVSSQKQAEELTIHSQRQEIVARIKRDALHIHPAFEFCDDGYSGSELLRPALETLRDQVSASLIDRLYIHSPDRLAQSLRIKPYCSMNLKSINARSSSSTRKVYPESPETNLLTQMQGMFAEYERAKILERTRRGRRHAAACGKVSVFGRAPLGYRYIGKVAGGGQARWEIDAHESVTVRLMFELVSARGSSLAAVCRELQSRGILTKKGNTKWDTSTVRGILTNPAYCGEARYGKERLVPRKPGRREARGSACAASSESCRGDIARRAG